MKIIYHKQVDPSDLPLDAVAETYVSCIKVENIKKHASNLLTEITDTSWISDLNPVAKMSYEGTAQKTINKLVKIFKAVDNKVTKDFGEFLISMSSGHCLRKKCNHKVLPLSELWKEKKSNNHGFDFHTLSPENKFSFGEAKFVSSGNSYTTSASQVFEFAQDGKDKIDAVHLMHFSEHLAIENLQAGKRGFVVAFSINTKNYKAVLGNSLNNKDIQGLTKCCDELYVIGVTA